jgi:hypothetical protein
MRKYIPLLVIVVLVSQLGFSFRSIAVAQTDAPGIREDRTETPISDKLDEVDAPSGEEAFQTLKNNLEQRLMSAEQRLLDLTEAINNAMYLDEETRMALITIIEDTQTGLSAYQYAVSTATTLAELQEINQEMITFLKDNQELIKEKIQETLLVIGDNFAEQVRILMEKLETTIVILKRLCPEESDLLGALETQLTDAEDLLKDLDQAIEDQDPAAIKEAMKTLLLLGLAINSNIAQLDESCLEVLPS